MRMLSIVDKCVRSNIDPSHLINQNTGVISIEPIIHPWYRPRVFDYYRPTIRITLETIIAGEIDTNIFDLLDDCCDLHHGYKLTRTTLEASNDEIQKIKYDCENADGPFVCHRSVLSADMISRLKHSIESDAGNEWKWLRPIKY